MHGYLKARFRPDCGFSFLLTLGMSYNPLRPSPSFALQTLANGSVLDVIKINEFQKEMAHLAGRGAAITELSGGRMNGKIHVPLGLVSKGTGLAPGNTFRLGKKSVAVPLWLNPGFDMLCFFFQVRLSSMYPRPALASGYVGSVFTVDVVSGGNAYQVAYTSWHQLTNLTNFPNNVGFFKFSIPLVSLFLNSPVHVEEIYLRLNFDATEGYADVLGLYPSGTLTNPEFYQGCMYFGAAAYKSIIPC